VSEPSGRRHVLRSFAAGEEIFREGDPGSEMFIIQEGQVEIVRHFEGGPRRLALLEKGDFFGEMALLDEQPRIATARAVSEASAVVITGATFTQMLRNEPEIAIRIMRKLSLRLREADQLLGHSAPPPAAVERSSSAAGFLTHRGSGIRLEIGWESTVAVGRRDPVTGIQPKVDLTGFDQERSVSRRHAKLVRRSGQLYLVEDLGTTNGTFVNGERIAPGEPIEVRDGDLLRFGLVELRYQDT
jgi:hypothetical protein